MAILALGAISDSDGALDAITPHLSSLIPFLLDELDNNQGLVRSSALWTLSKYNEYVCKQDNE